MTTDFTAVIFGVGVGAWVYNKLIHRTGGNVKTTTIASLLVAAIAFLVWFTAFHFFLGQ